MLLNQFSENISKLKKEGKDFSERLVDVDKNVLKKIMKEYIESKRSLMRKGKDKNNINDICF